MIKQVKNIVTSPAFIITSAMLFTTMAEAGSLGTTGGGTGGAVFKPFFDFMYDASTGYLGRGLALTGGIIGLGIGAMSGKIQIALLGIPLALFGIFGPLIADSFFTSALIF